MVFSLCLYPFSLGSLPQAAFSLDVPHILVLPVPCTFQDSALCIVCLLHSITSPAPDYKLLYFCCVCVVMPMDAKVPSLGTEFSP